MPGLTSSTSCQEVLMDTGDVTCTGMKTICTCMQRLCAKIFPNDYKHQELPCARREASSLLCLRRASCGLPAWAVVDAEPAPAMPVHAAAAPAVPDAAGGIPAYPRTVLRDMTGQPCHVIPLRGLDVVSNYANDREFDGNDREAALRWLVSLDPRANCPNERVCLSPPQALTSLSDDAHAVSPLGHHQFYSGRLRVVVIHSHAVDAMS